MIKKEEGDDNRPETRSKNRIKLNKKYTSSDSAFKKVNVRKEDMVIKYFLSNK